MIEKVLSGEPSEPKYCTGCACDSEREEPFTLTLNNSATLGKTQG